MALAPFPAIVLAKVLYIRFEPSKKSEVIRVVKKGEVVRVVNGPVLREKCSWVRIEEENIFCEAWVQMTDENGRDLIK